MIEEIKDWLKTCPFLRVYGTTTKPKISVDSMGDKTTEYTILTNPVSPTIEEYNDGSRLKQISVDIRSLELATTQAQNVANNQFCERLESWVAEQNRGTLPSGWQNAECISNGYLYSDEGENKAVYSITIVIQYIEEG